MKIALIAITKHGVGHALKLKGALPEAELWISEKQKGEGQAGAQYFGTIKELTQQLWDKVEGLVYVVSLGAVIRTIAPFLKTKDTDPAVVVVDDACKYAISVLSGHVGGANELTEKLANILGAQAVVTTASDVRATIAVDILGRELGWQLEGKENVTPVSAAVVNEKPVAFVQECGDTHWWTRPSPVPKNIRLFKTLPEAIAAGPFDAYLVVSDRASSALKTQLGAEWSKTVVYRPKSLFLGMGCDYGSSLEELDELLKHTLEESGLSEKSIAGIATIDIKADEACLNGLAEKLGLKLQLFTKEELNDKKTKSMPNPLVMKYTGAVGVCEPSAMLSAGVGDLLVMKHKSQKATLAIARKEFS